MKQKLQLFKNKILSEEIIPDNLVEVILSKKKDRAFLQEMEEFLLDVWEEAEVNFKRHIRETLDVIWRFL